MWVMTRRLESAPEALVLHCVFHPRAQQTIVLAVLVVVNLVAALLVVAPSLLRVRRARGAGQAGSNPTRIMSLLGGHGKDEAIADGQDFMVS